jgi:hypothetical protein
MSRNFLKLFSIEIAARFLPCGPALPAAKFSGHEQKARAWARAIARRGLAGAPLFPDGS